MKKLSGYIFSLLLAVPASAFAQAPASPLTLDKIEGALRQIVTFFLSAGVLVSVIYIIWGGLAYMAAGGDETKSGEAKKRILNGVIGAAVILGVGVILSTIANFF